MTLEELKKTIRCEAEKWEAEFSWAAAEAAGPLDTVYDRCGGNLDDAYQIGFDDGHADAMFGVAKYLRKLVEGA